MTSQLCPYRGLLTYWVIAIIVFVDVGQINHMTSHGYVRIIVSVIEPVLVVYTGGCMSSLVRSQGRTADTLCWSVYYY